MESMREGVGVVIGRFQVAELHEGHQALLNEADKHRKLCIFVGMSPSQIGTRGDPMDYPTREQMIKEKYPSAVVHPLMDQPDDGFWSRQLDQTIHALYPHDKATLYCGRDSFRDHYMGKLPIREIDPIPNVSGTNARDIHGTTVENHASFRKGQIYSAYNRWQPIFPCVDIVCTRELRVLVGNRSNEPGKHRLPGGHVDAKDDTAEQAAQRELREETGIECGNMQYVGEYRIESWRDRPGGGVMRTTLFHTEYVSGPAQGADDLDGVRWVHFDQLKNLRWADSHAMLVDRFLDYYSRLYGAR